VRAIAVNLGIRPGVKAAACCFETPPQGKKRASSMRRGFSAEVPTLLRGQRGL
jgi:hypothetical protein